jgi:ribose transport system substrate-binding protein
LTRRWLAPAAAVALAAVLCAAAGCGGKTETATGKGPKGEELTLTAPEAQTIYQGHQNRVPIKIGRKGFNDAVDLEFAEMPKGISATFQRVEAGADTGSLNLHVTADATPMDHVLKLTAKGGGATASVTFTLTVKKPTVAYVTNGIDPFWTIAEKGATDAAAKFDVELKVIMPPGGLDDQKRMVEDALARGVQGVAISPINPEAQADLLQQIADRTGGNMITQDSDAPNSPRKCFIGPDNYKAGRKVGELVKQAMPAGGKVMIFIGRLEQANARLRRQGVIDELLGRGDDPKRNDPVDQEQKGDKYTVLGTRTDDFDNAKAKALAQDALIRHPDLGCMVGLFAYNPPLCLDAIRDAGKVGKIKVVGFDENKITLQGIKDGDVYGTVVQDPYKYGYESVRLLASMARGDASVLPKGGVLDVPAQSITRANLEAFWKELKARLGEGK